MIAASAWLDIAKASSLTEPLCVLNTWVQNPRTCCFHLRRNFRSPARASCWSR